MTTCQLHNFEYMGIHFCDGVRSLPGGSARRRYFARVFFCKQCLETRSTPLPDKQYTSFYKPAEYGFDASPGTADECGVPLEDR